jgi:hypothetical protein
MLPGKDAVCRHEELESDHRWRWPDSNTSRGGVVPADYPMVLALTPFISFPIRL